MRWKLLPQTFQVVTSLNLDFVQCFFREHLRTVGTKLITSATNRDVIFIAGLEMNTLIPISQQKTVRMDAQKHHSNCTSNVVPSYFECWGVWCCSSVRANSKPGIASGHQVLALPATSRPENATTKWMIFAMNDEMIFEALSFLSLVFLKVFQVLFWAVPHFHPFSFLKLQHAMPLEKNALQAANFLEPHVTTSHLCCPVGDLSQPIMAFCVLKMTKDWILGDKNGQKTSPLPRGTP